MNDENRLLEEIRTALANELATLGESILKTKSIWKNSAAPKIMGQWKWAMFNSELSSASGSILRCIKFVNEEKPLPIDKTVDELIEKFKALTTRKAKEEVCGKLRQAFTEILKEAKQ